MRGHSWYFFGSCNGIITAGGPFRTESIARDEAGNIRDFDSEPEYFCWKTIQLKEAKS
jgi:hypothetical protein